MMPLSRSRVGTRPTIQISGFCRSKQEANPFLTYKPSQTRIEHNFLPTADGSRTRRMSLAGRRSTCKPSTAPHPQAAGKFLISTAGGSQPSWRGDGKELFYLSPDNKLMAVEVDTKGTFRSGSQSHSSSSMDSFAGEREITTTFLRMASAFWWQSCGGQRRRFRLMCSLTGRLS